MFLGRFRTQHWVLVSAMVFAALLLLLPQGAGPSIAAQVTETLPPATPGPNHLPAIYKMPTPTPLPGWQISYYNNKDLIGPAVTTQTKTYAAPEEEWGLNAPAAGVLADGFSTRFTRNLAFDAGTYAFYLTADDGARLYIDGVLVIDEWHGTERGTATYRYQQTLTAGLHAFIVEQYDDQGEARVRLQWRNEAQFPNTQWRAEYYTNANLSGTPAVVRNESSINFYWGAGSPVAGIPADNFSVRFTRPVYFDGGTRILYTEADDRVRVWVDKWAPGTEVIEDWEGSQRWNSGRQLMDEAGWYLITIEYAELGNDATMRYFDLYGGSSGSWTVEYFDDYDWDEPDEDNVNVLADREPDESGNMMYKNEPCIEFVASDMPDGIGGGDDTEPRDDFAVRFTRYRQLSGKYEFTVQFDDGMRLWIDGDLVRDEWKSQGQVVTKSVTRTLHDGFHVIKLEYYDGRGAAVAKLCWAKK